MSGKYNNTPTTAFGITFDSKLEASMYMTLWARERTGEISDLRLQVPFRCEVNGILVCRYIADFVWLENGSQIVADAKGYKTATYRLKKKLVKACCGIDVVELP